MRTGMLKAGQVASEGLQVAAPFVPGGTIVNAIAGDHVAGLFHLAVSSLLALLTLAQDKCRSLVQQ